MIWGQGVGAARSRFAARTRPLDALTKNTLLMGLQCDCNPCLTGEGRGLGRSPNGGRYV